MNTEFKKFFGFSKFFETQKITNDYRTTKYYKISTYNSFIIFTLLGIFLVRFTINFFNNKDYYIKNIVYKRKLIRCIILFH